MRVAPVGELSLINHTPHNASVRTEGAVECAVIEHGSLEMQLQVRRDIGHVIYRNLARGIGEKFTRAAATGSDRTTAMGAQ